MNTIVTDTFRRALIDYLYLMNRRYSPKSSLKLVCDRYGLDRVQRTVLFRGVTDGETARKRKRMLEYSIEGKEIMVDTYNVLFTVCNYLLGRVLYIANDGFLRDAGEVFGKPLRDRFMEKSVALIFDYFAERKPAVLHFLLDSPVSYSGNLAGELRHRLETISLRGGTEVVPSPDYFLKRAEKGIIATSDSVVLDKTTVSVVDIARLVLEEHYTPSFIRIDHLVAEGPS